MLRLRQVCLFLALVASIVCVVGLVAGPAGLWRGAAMTAAVSLAIGFGAVSTIRGYQYTAWIAVAFLAGMLYPGSFQQFKDYQWAGLLIVQSVMFGMGTQMKLKDFAAVARMPWGVVVGLMCQFTIMPLVGFGLTKLFDFPPEIGAGIILIGSCSSGLASNVMAYLAKANLALSITVTSVATLLAPLLTPLWMSLLAGQLVEVKFLAMMASVVKIVLVPVSAALLHDYLVHASPSGKRAVRVVGAIGLVWLIFLVFGGWGLLQSSLEGNALLLAALPGHLFSAVIVGLIYHQLTRILPSIENAMPYASMFGIVYFTTVATAAGQESLMQVGFLLFFAAVLHNTAGYFLGYWLSRGFGLDRNSARTIAFEVGLQNGGMASGLALSMGKLGTVGLASAIFSPWMNISGSILANFWKRRPVHDS